MKKYLVLTIILFSFYISYSSSHVEHYKNLNHLNYLLFFNDKPIGNHSFDFKKKGSLLHVKSNGNFKLDKMGINLMDYYTTSEEIYKNGQLIEFNSKTKQNNKEKYVQISLNKKNLLFIDGSSFKGETDKTTVVGTWWNHSIINKNQQISPISGRLLPQKVKYLGKETIKINNKNYNSLHFHFISDNSKPIEKKKLNIHVWYDEKSLLWLKSSYDKLGKWEYRLEDVR